MTSRQVRLTPAGLTHASSVIRVVSRNDGASGIVTRAFDAVERERVAELARSSSRSLFAIVPVLPLPDASATVVPDALVERVRGDRGRMRGAVVVAVAVLE